MTNRHASTADGNRAFRERLRVPSTIEEIEAAEGRLVAELTRLGYDESSIFAVRLAFQEAANNARTHGNARDPSKRIGFAFDIDEDRATIEIEDEGTGYDPATIPDPTSEENLEIPAGRGLTLIRAFMAEVEIIAPGNRIRMTYARETSKRRNVETSK